MSGIEIPSKEYRRSKGKPMTPDQMAKQFGPLPRPMRVFTTTEDMDGDRNSRLRRPPIRPEGAPPDKMHPERISTLIPTDEEASEEWL